MRIIALRKTYNNFFGKRLKKLGIQKFGIRTDAAFKFLFGSFFMPKLSGSCCQNWLHPSSVDRQHLGQCVYGFDKCCKLSWRENRTSFRKDRMQCQYRCGGGHQVFFFVFALRLSWGSRRMVAAGVTVIIGPGCSDGSVAAGPVAAASRIPLVCYSSTSSVLSSVSIFPFFARVSYIDSNQLVVFEALRKRLPKFFHFVFSRPIVCIMQIFVGASGCCLRAECVRSECR